MYDTALGTYDAEQTNRLSSYFGERDTSFGAIVLFIRTRLLRYSILRRVVFLLRSAASAILSTGDYRTGDYRAKSAILQEGLIRAKTVSARRVIRAKTVFSWAQLAAVHILVHCPVSGVGRLNGSLSFLLT